MSKGTLCLNCVAEAVYYVTQLPSHTKVYTNIPSLCNNLKDIGDRHDIIVGWKYKRVARRSRVVYIVSKDVLAPWKRVDVVVTRALTAHRPAIFVDRKEFLNYLRTSLNSGVTIATKDLGLIEAIGSCRNDVWYTTNMNRVISIPVVVGKCVEPEYVETGRLVFYVARE